MITAALHRPRQRTPLLSPGGGFPRVAFYYGKADQFDLLGRFDLAVIEPDHGQTLPSGPAIQTRWLAYVSLGEVLQSRHYFDAIPKEWLIQHNDAWRSWIIDQSTRDWPVFFTQRIAHPLWQQKFHGFFLDTMDSYQLLDSRTHPASSQRRGLIRAVTALRSRFPQSLIILNRGFELLHALHSKIDAVAFESLYRTWDQRRGAYRTVSPHDRNWLLSQAAIARSHGLPTISIDYCPSDDLRLCRQIAQWIRQHGIIPYITDNYLQTVNADLLEADASDSVIAFPSTDLAAKHPV